MAVIQFAPKALKDLDEIKSHIQNELENDIAAANTVKKIIAPISELEEFLNMGARVSSVTTADNDYRYLLCNNYTAFYRYEQNTVFVVRVLYSRRDYIKILFE